MSKKPQKQLDQVNHPEHYTKHPSGIECIQVTEHMSFCLGNALKYIWRCDHKGNAIEDLEKAQFYLQREIDLRLGKTSQKEQNRNKPKNINNAPPVTIRAAGEMLLKIADAAEQNEIELTAEIDFQKNRPAEMCGSKNDFQQWQPGRFETIKLALNASIHHLNK